MDEINLDVLTDAIVKYESGAYMTKESLREVLRTITSEIYYLTKHQIEAKNAHNSFLYNWNGPVARGEIAAHQEIPELYQLRHLIKAAQNVVTSITMEISIINRES